MHRRFRLECPLLPLSAWWLPRGTGGVVYPARVNGTAARRMAWQTGTVVVFRLNGGVSPENLSAIRPLLTQLTGGQVSSTPEGPHVEARWKAVMPAARIASCYRHCGASRNAHGCVLNGPRAAPLTGSSVMYPSRRDPRKARLPKES